MNDCEAEPNQVGDGLEPEQAITPLRSGAHLERIAELEEERRFLLRSLEDLEREHDVGDVDDADYSTLLDGYTVRTAAVLREIGSVERIPEFIARAKDKNDPYRLMGFGHRVYKNTDPRATVLKQSADEVLELLGVENNPLLQIAKELERMALSDPYFIEKKLFPNVDFYSGIILEAMGFPTSMFTPIFAVSRTVGWISQWKEMITDPQMKIGRPRQLYLGETARDYVDIENR